MQLDRLRNLTKRTLGGLWLPSVFLIVALWAIWPCPLVISHAIPTGDSPTATVPLLNAWILWWNAEQLFHGYHAYWQAPIFHPFERSLALSEPQPAAVIVAPFVHFSSLATAYNVYLCATIVLNGMFTYRFLKRMACSTLCSVAGGIGICIHPLAISNLEAVQLVPFWSIIWAWDSSVQLVSRPRFSQALYLTVATLVTAMMCLHHTLFLAFVLTPSFLLTAFLGRQNDEAAEAKAARRITPVLYFVLSTGVAAALTWAWVYPLLETHADLNLERRIETITTLSGDFADWQSVPTSSIWSFANTLHSFALNPGWLRLLLSVLTLFYIRRTEANARNALLLLLGIQIASFTLSFGGHLSLFGHNLWETLCEWLTIVRGIRSPYRFAYFTQAVTIISASWMCGRLHLATRGWKTSTQRVGQAAVLLLAFAVAFEIPPARSHVAQLVMPQHAPEWIEIVRNSPGPILCLPPSASNAEADCEVDARWMLYGTLHKQPILNGYSGFLPKDWVTLRDRLNQHAWNAEVAHEIRQRGAKYVVVRTESWNQDTSVLSSDMRLLHRSRLFELWEFK